MLPAVRFAAVLCCAALAACAHPGLVITDPAKALAGSLAGVAAGRYRFDVAFPNGHLAGAVDKADRQAQWTDTMDNQPGRIINQNRVIGTDMYVATSGVGGLGSGKTPLTVDYWEHFDLSRQAADDDPLTNPDVTRLTAQLPYGDDIDPAGPLTVTISAYGASVGPAPRPSSTSEAPALVYQQN